MVQSHGERLAELLDLSRKLGDPERKWAILGEGNASARADGETFFVKASGSRLATLQESQVAHVRFAPILATIESGEMLSDIECMDRLRSAAIGPEGVMPSVETLMHAFLLTLPEIAFVGHTHVTSINGVVCSKRGWGFLTSGQRLFPDEIVVCGPAACCIEYVKPGLILARRIREQVTAYREKFGTPPKSIFLQNHGFIALGRTAQEVESIHQMADKAAHILIAALSAGEPTSLTPEQVDDIYVWPAEHFRQRALGLTDDAG
ncbi:MAG TPA: class II aldolase/adducin family protein [Capsulimonadaceae bacterium]|nr:class II aldolase/adducin family protein [Capsulimonadaceae bacterium]